MSVSDNLAPSSADPDAQPQWLGRRLTVEVGPVAHGGHCVARHEGRVLFVRHALPGETVVALVTEDKGGSFCRADAVEVITPSADRVPQPCVYAHPGGCGGCDFQHVVPARQRELKAEVVREQLVRLGGLSPERVASLVVEELPGGPLGWRSRVEFAAGDDGRLGLRRHRSHEVIAVQACPIAVPAVNDSGVLAGTWPPRSTVDVVTSSTGDVAVRLARPGGAGRVVRGPRSVVERAADRRWRVRAEGFWQVHPAAPQALVDAVLEGLRPAPGESFVDLYAGAGLFCGPLAAAVGRAGRGTAVESDRDGAADARRNLRDLPQVTVVTGRVEAVLRRDTVCEADLVVLDPPRSGAGAAVVRRVAALRPRALAYVACDPAALGRDVRTFAEAGYELVSVRAFDAFPMTHHVECVAIFSPVPEAEPAP